MLYKVITIKDKKEKLRAGYEREIKKLNEWLKQRVVEEKKEREAFNENQDRIEKEILNKFKGDETRRWKELELIAKRKLAEEEFEEQLKQKRKELAEKKREMEKEYLKNKKYMEEEEKEQREKTGYSGIKKYKKLEEELAKLKDEGRRKSEEAQDILSRLNIKEEEKAQLKSRLNEARKNIKAKKEGFFSKLFSRAGKEKEQGEEGLLICQKSPKKRFLSMLKNHRFLTKEKTGLRGKLDKCYSIMDTAQNYLENDEIDKAKKLYLECRELYLKLDDEEKALIYNKLERLYTLIKTKG